MTKQLIKSDIVYHGDNQSVQTKSTKLAVKSTMHDIVSVVDIVKAKSENTKWTPVRGWGSHDNRPSAFFVCSENGVSCTLSIKSSKNNNDNYIEWFLSVTAGNLQLGSETCTPVVNEVWSLDDFERAIKRVHHSVFRKVNDSLLDMYDVESILYSKASYSAHVLSVELKHLERLILKTIAGQ